MTIQVEIVKPVPTAFKLQMGVIAVYFFSYWWLWQTLSNYSYFDSEISYYFGAFYYYTLIYPVEIIEDVFLYIVDFTQKGPSDEFTPILWGGVGALFYISILIGTVRIILQSKYNGLFVALLIIPGLGWLVLGSLDWLIWQIFSFDINDVLNPPEVIVY